jgi:hypothetical protein
MKRNQPASMSPWIHRLVAAALLFALSVCAVAQSGPYERSFHQSKGVVEKALKQLQPSMSGRLPVLDGFATDRDHPLDRYERGYFQSSVRVTPTPSGGCIVKVAAKVTAWYSDPVPSRSGYRLLTSNGRLENDLLDQLAEQLIGTPDTAESSARKPVTPKPEPEPALSAPMPNIAAQKPAFPASLHPGISQSEVAESKIAPAKGHDSADLQAEAASLEEALKNQAHPKNIVAVKKSGTPVVATPSLSAKPLFMASMHDEFEMLDFNRDWVHVRISGLSRGWIWRDSLEMPDNIPDNPQATLGPPPAADLFQVTREEIGLFPGDWQPLRGKNVKIVSVQKVNESEKNAGPQAKLEFAKYLLDKNYAELARKSKDLSGIVLIFDSADGGMVAATFASIRQWKAGALTDSALWHQCFFDPPETFSATGASASQ